MDMVWSVRCLGILLVLLMAGCGGGDSGLTETSSPSTVTTATAAATPTVTAAPSAALDAPELSSPTPTSLAEVELGPAPSAEPTPVVNLPEPTPSATVAVEPAPSASAEPAAESGPPAWLIPASSASHAELLDAAKDSPFHRFGDDVYTWDDERRLVVLKIPVSHPAMEELMFNLFGESVGIVDTPGTRSWVEQCARRDADYNLGLDPSVSIYGFISAQSIYACLGGLSRLTTLYSRYWWDEAGESCLVDAVAVYALHPNDHPRPLSVCPSVGYDPNDLPVNPDEAWLAQQCQAIVDANPNPQYPTDPSISVEPLPSCWVPNIQVVISHAGERVELGLPDSPHECYHAFLGFVWARQTGRDSRSPFDLSVGCTYRADEAAP